MMGREPVMVGVVTVEAAAAALITLLTEFGVVQLSAGQVAAVMAVVTIVAGLFVRSYVTPTVVADEAARRAFADGLRLPPPDGSHEGESLV